LPIWSNFAGKYTHRTGLEVHKQQTLWEQFRQGDADAFRRLYDRHWEALYAMARRKIAVEEEAADLVQEVFLKLWEKQQELPAVESVEAYLATALRNLIFNHYRRATVVRAATADLRSDASGPTALDMLQAQELHQLIDREVAAMPEKMREVYLLSRHEELSAPEIALQLTLSQQTVRNQISSALKRLRAVIGYHGNSTYPQL
jgi:RNA polymerase sigma-70 factor (family 1)